jgi:Family of unknown function (DUF6519)
VKGDFSRITFRPERHYSSVLMQQGRVSLDSHWNEQAAIVLQANRAVVRDLLGPHGGVGDGFRIRPQHRERGREAPWDVLVDAGFYYVEGIRCENTRTISHRRTVRESGCEEDVPEEPGHYLVYLEVWDRHVTAVEDPALREQALGGPDTTTRLQVVWRVGLMVLDPSKLGSPEAFLAERFERAGTPGLRARVLPPAGYTGLENHLYRVEVHAGGRSAEATFKWSRDNGSVVASVVAVESDRLVIAPTGGEGFSVGMWVEPEDETSALCGQLPPLIRIESMDGDGLITSPSWPLERTRPTYRLIRRWDQGATGDASRDGAVPIVEGGWMDLEAGIQIAFDAGGDYRAGDYWLFPARPAGGGIEWPTRSGKPLSKPPGGTEPHRAPLAHLEVGGDGSVRVVRDLRRLFRRLAD